MDWSTIVIIIVLIAIAIALVLYLRSRADSLSDMDGSVITGGARPKHKKAGNMRIKDLQKHPRSKSEAEVVRYLEEITGQKFPTVYPKWLVWKGSTLELDGFSEKLNIALEFSGPLHTKWYPQKESYMDYFDRVVKDVVKKRLCKRHGVHLMVVDASLPSKHWRDYVKSRLYDYGFLTDQPIPYINEQIAEPYRNEQQEEELGLEVEMRAALKA